MHDWRTQPRSQDPSILRNLTANLDDQPKRNSLLVGTSTLTVWFFVEFFHTRPYIPCEPSQKSPILTCECILGYAFLDCLHNLHQQMFRNILNARVTPSFQYLARKKSTLSLVPHSNRTRYFSLLGAGTTVSVCLLLGHTIYADGFENAGMSGGINWVRKHGLKRVDSVGIPRHVFLQFYVVFFDNTFFLATSLWKMLGASPAQSSRTQ